MFTRLHPGRGLRMRSCVLIVLSCLATTSFAQSTSAEDLREYTGNGFTIRYPATWQVDASRTMGAELFLYSPLEGSTDQFRENINVIIQDLTGQQIDLAKYKDITENQFKSMGAAVEVYESVLKSAGGSKWYYVSYTLTQGQLRIRAVSKCFVVNEKAYLVTFTSDVNKYEQYASQASNLLETFVVKPQ